MTQYGLTPNGPNPKRLDVILDEMHESITERIGVNTKQNTESLLNHILTNIADRLAELWEFGVDVYYSQYPSSAEGSSLDNVLQFSGITREMPTKSYYPILCTGLDGTTIPAGTLITTDTNPETNLVLDADAVISRSAFNKAVVIMTTESNTDLVSIVLNGVLFSAATLEELSATVTSENLSVSYAEGKMSIEAEDDTSSNTMILSENLTTETVSTVVVFPTEDYGDIIIPNGVITNIVKSVVGLQSVVNVGSHIAGRLAQTDTEARQSYIDKIFNNSSKMLESIRSSILENVQGVLSVAVYENNTNQTDATGRPPHSIEVVVDGGDKTEIAQQILDKKAGGISTYCVDGENGVTVTLKGLYGEDIDVRFNRPTDVYIWFHVGVTLNTQTNLPTNYAELIKDTILKCMEDVGAGDDVVPQRFTNELHNTVPGIDYFDIKLFSTRSASERPTDYRERSVTISERERAETSESRIGVVIDG